MAYSQLFLILFIVLNSIVYLTAQYRPTPHPGNRLEVVLKHSFDLKCEYTGVGGDGEFLEWYKKNATHDVLVTDKPGHYVTNKSEKESNLTIKIFVNADANVTRWYVKTKKYGYEYACQFGQISLIPSPQGIEDDKGVTLDSANGSLRRSEDQSLNLKCLIEPKNIDGGNRIQWEFRSINDQKFTNLPEDVKIQGDEIQIDSVKKYHRGYYRCTLNGVEFTILLRVKDRLAALWPFIGIVCIVLVLVIIILIFERRQKSSKKTAATDDDDQDRASDPLVRTLTKTSDNDNRKRTVKA